MTSHPLTIVTWKWKSGTYHTEFKAEHVNTWARMVSRNLTLPHRLLCITDDPTGVDVETLPLWDEFTDISLPGWDPYRRPQCYRRIKLFDPSLVDILGPRFVCMDLDCVILTNIDRVLSRTEDFIIVKGSSPYHNPYAGCMFMMDTGSRPQVYRNFSAKAAERSSRWTGSDQAWIMQCLGGNEAVWTTMDGVYSYKQFTEPGDRFKWRDPARITGVPMIIFFNGTKDMPWHESIRKKHRFVRENYL